MTDLQKVRDAKQQAMADISGIDATTPQGAKQIPAEFKNERGTIKVDRFGRLAVEAEARSTSGLVATVGQLAVSPGAVNVVPGEVTVSLDVRHPDDSVREDHRRRLLKVADDIARRRGLSVQSLLTDEEDSIACSPQLTSVLARAVKELGHPEMQLASGAGHDAVVMSRLTEVAMLFVRCKDGVSHSPAESVTEDDVEVAIDVLSKLLELLADHR